MTENYVLCFFLRLLRRERQEYLKKTKGKEIMFKRIAKYMKKEEKL